MALILSPPGQFQGTAEQQLRQCYTYLFGLHQQLNAAMGSLDTAVTTATAAAQNARSAPKEELQSLKALVVGNASLVRQEMEKLETQLRERFVAVSDFGTYLRELNASLEADAEALTQYYSFLSSLEAEMEAVDSAFQSYLVRTEGYIRTGIVDYDGEIPIYGVAVGQGLTTLEKDGETVITSGHFRSTFTSRRLSFWQGDAEVAYLSDNRLYITNITVLGSLNLGGSWSVGHAGGFTIKWIGG